MIKASDLGKTKMVTQVIAIALVMLAVHWPELKLIAMVWLWGVVIFALVSAFDYFLKFWRRVDDSVKLRRRRELLILARQQRLERRRKRKTR